ncbi:6-phosphogluconolactonase [Desulfopila sp. IMCC35008]|uniref:6-phosphogluconolactonase n=1 Tax=Desulfopila sp. IMCC35008 TaxID=2653858 RepID=UPI0013D77031|nr:6-phosphogluconolactonase [Desulfopila sp. IMCC35008]
MAKDNFMVLQALPEMLAKKAAWIIYKEGIEKLLESQPHVVLAVPGGRNVIPVFKALGEFKIDWQRVHIFMVDERFVPVTDEQSNYRLLFEQLGDILPAESLHPFEFDDVDRRGAVGRYAQMLNKLGGRFDIVLLSSGEDGHIASLFPGRGEVHRTRESFVLITDAPKPPPTRVSATFELLKKSSVGLLLVIGEGKQQALDIFLDDSVDMDSCPAKVIAGLPKYFVLTDREVSLPL